MTPSPTASDYARAPPPTQPPIPNPIRPGRSKFNEALMKSRWKVNWCKFDEISMKSQLIFDEKSMNFWWKVNEFLMKSRWNMDEKSMKYGWKVYEISMKSRWKKQRMNKLIG